MTVRLVDTNILMYAVSADPSEHVKAAKARAVLAERDLGLSAQVLQEFYVQTTRATREHRLTHEQALDFVTALGRFPVYPTSLEVVQTATRTRARFNVSYWDAAIIEAARLLGCHEVLSEDLNHGQGYAGIVVTNPFR